LVQLTTKDNVDHVGHSLQLKLLKDFMMLLKENMLNFLFNKLSIVHHTLVLKDVMEVGHNGLMNMYKNMVLN